MKPTSPPDAVTFLLSYLGTTLVMLVLIAGLAVLWANRQGAKAKRGWNLVTVLKAARDLEAGTVLARSDVEVGQLPEQFATASVVMPLDASGLVGKTLTTPLKRGDTVWLAHVAPRPVLRGCEARIAQAWGPGNPAGLSAVLEAVRAEVRAREAGQP